jgi:hypothetical protein
LYKKQGYEVVHMSAPDKKYNQDGYAGPSYLDDILEMYMQYDNKDVLFDRSIYGEFIWPHVYGRKANLEEDEVDILREFEDRNDVQRFLMVDPNVEAHWKRCVENNEPLTRPQFTLAGRLFDKLAHRFNFIPRQLSDFGSELAKSDSNDAAPIEESGTPQPLPEGKGPIDVRNGQGTGVVTPKAKEDGKTKEQVVLEKANAINSILSKRIIKQKGAIFDAIETDIKSYLNDQLKVLFNGGTNIHEALTKEEITVLKLYATKILEKQKEKA